MIPAPPSFDGPFSKFFDAYVLPNTPSVDRVREFDRRLRRSLSAPDPVFPIRALRGLDRGQIARTETGFQVLPTDNAPVWWLHAFLLSDDPFPEDDATLFESLPCHMFRRPRDRSDLNAAGYHAAHLVDAKNGDTDWTHWSRQELERRVLVSIHPCNMVLVAKQDWQRWGGRRDIIAWCQDRYVERFGDLMSSFLERAGAARVESDCPADITYTYPTSKSEKATRTTPTRILHKAQPGTVKTNRPIIKKSLIGADVTLDIATEGRRYAIPHDTLVAWVEANTGALATHSWMERGLYSWTKPSRAMKDFLSDFEA